MSNKEYIYIPGKGNLLKEEAEKNGFICDRCQNKVQFSKDMGTQNRNHCPDCLWSKHVDLEKSGDRESECDGLMDPVGLTFKQEGTGKWGKIKQGELMLVHKCTKCGALSINRIAGDDNADEIVKIYEESLKLDEEVLKKLQEERISLLREKDGEEMRNQLFGYRRI